MQTITRKLAPLDIQINHWAVGDDPQLHPLLSLQQLSDKEQVLAAFNHSFETLQQVANDRSRDLIVLHSARLAERGLGWGRATVEVRLAEHHTVSIRISLPGANQKETVITAMERLKTLLHSVTLEKTEPRAIEIVCYIGGTRYE